jgi:hypothetical protein
MTEPFSTLTRHDLEAKIVKRCGRTKPFSQRIRTAAPSSGFLCLNNIDWHGNHLLHV